MDAVPAGAASALPCHHRYRRRPQLRRSSRLPADGARRRAHGGPLGGRSARQLTITQIMNVFLICCVTSVCAMWQNTLGEHRSAADQSIINPRYAPKLEDAGT